MGRGICPWCGKEVDKFIMFRGDVVGCRYCGIHTKPTNADRIRAMSDEELAEFIAYSTSCETCVVRKGGSDECHNTNCSTVWLGWLKQEAKDV